MFLVRLGRDRQGGGVPVVLSHMLHITAVLGTYCELHRGFRKCVVVYASKDVVFNMFFFFNNVDRGCCLFGRSRSVGIGYVRVHFGGWV